MNMDHFVYFIETVKNNSFTVAAQKLYINQSTISKAIRTLEKEYDTELIDRTAKRFKLTSAGEVFYHSAVKIVSNYKAEKDLLSVQLKSRRGTLTLGIPPVTGTVVHYIISEYCRKYPEIQVRFLELGANKIYSLAKSGAIDLGILIQPFEDSDFFQIPFLYSCLVCVASAKHPRIRNKTRVTLRELEDETICLLDKTFMLHDMVIDMYKQAGIMPQIVFESIQWDLLIENTAHSDNITFLPKPIIEKFKRDDIISPLLEEPYQQWIPTAVYHKEKFLSEPIKLFLDLLQQEKLSVVR